MIMRKLIDQIPFFAQFSHEDKVMLAEVGNFFETYEKGNVIIQEGTTGDTLFVIIRGSVAVNKNSYPERALATLKAGAVFGEISFLMRRPRSTNVVAEEKTTCFVMNNETLKEMSPTLQIQFKDQLIEILVKRLDAMNDVIPSMLG